MRSPQFILAACLFLSVGVGGCGSDDPEQPLPAPEAPGPRPEAPGEASTCTVATQRLLDHYSELKQCSRNSDCNYVDRYYEVVDRDDHTHFVTTEDCKSVTPFLVVTNRASLETSLSQVEAEKAAQEQACALPPDSVTCQAFSGFVSALPPVCTDGVCARPSG